MKEDGNRKSVLKEHWDLNEGQFIADETLPLNPLRQLLKAKNKTFWLETLYICLPFYGFTFFKFFFNIHICMFYLL